MIYQAIAAGSEIENIVSKKEEGKFHVHHRFTNGFTLMNNNQIIYIGNDKKGVLPFGIHLDNLDYQTIRKQKTPVCQFKQYEGLNYLVDRTFEVEIPTNIFYKETLGLSSINPSDLRQKVYQIETYNLVDDNQFEGERKGTVPAFQKLLSDEPINQAKGILYYLGRGNGDIPSGDCFLIGLIAMDRFFQFLPKNFYLLLESFLIDKKWTTILGNTYLSNACKRNFGSSINSAVKGVICNSDNWGINVLVLNNLGHSISSAILSGMIAGINIYLNSIDN